jgi:hypothetical protein
MMERASKLYAAWVTVSVAVGAAIAIVVSAGDTGHVPWLVASLQLVVAAVVFGIVAGFPFAVLAGLLTQRLLGKGSAIGLSALVGLLSGLVGGLVVSILLDVRLPSIWGGIAGLAVGSVCGLPVGRMSAIKQNAP